MADERHEDVVSRYSQIAHMRTPLRRWNERCLPEEIVGLARRGSEEKVNALYITERRTEKPYFDRRSHLFFLESLTLCKNLYPPCLSHAMQHERHALLELNASGDVGHEHLESVNLP
jgi:hypothetical protein